MMLVPLLGRLRLPLAAAIASVALAGVVSVPTVNDDAPRSGDEVRAGAEEEAQPGPAGAAAEVAPAPGTAETTVAPGAAPAGAAPAGAPEAADATTTTAPRAAAPTGGEAIKVGVLLLNVGNVEKLGVAVGVNPEQQRKAWDAYIAELNESGGINGRKVSPVYRQYDVTSNDSQRAACLAVTEDAKVFAVLDIALTSANALCISQEHATPLITLQPMPKDAYEKSQGRLFTLFAEASRVWRNVANLLHADGQLKGRTIGILGDTAPGNPPTIDAFEAELRRLGYKVAHRSRLPSDGSSAQLPQATSQVPVEVQQMRQKGVDLVFLATGVVTATHFAQTADSQGWRPKYAATDWANAYSDTYVQNMPRSFDGTLVTTNRTGEFRVKRPEPEQDRRCRTTFERRTGAKLDRSTVEYNSTIRLCTLLDVFARGAKAAGADLTRPRLGQGIQSIGPLPLSTFGGGSFRAGKFDAADQLRTARFAAECRCWVPRTEFRDPAYR